MTDYCSLYVTVPEVAEAETIARILLEEKLIACANISGAILSLYRWQGDICREGEVAMILKTRRSKSTQVMARIKELHTYDTPCIIQWDIAAGDADYLSWIGQQIKV